jgi:hypothetical protein
MSSVATPVVIRLDLLGQTAAVQVASNASPKAVEDQARIMWGQAVEFKARCPITWILSKVYHMQTVPDLRVTLIPTEARANLVDLSPTQVKVSIIMVAGRDQYRESNITSSTHGHRSRYKGVISYHSMQLSQTTTRTTRFMMWMFVTLRKSRIGLTS